MKNDPIAPGPHPNYVKAYLDFYGKKQVEAAEVIGIQKAGMNKIVKGDRRLKAEDAKALWAWLGLPENEWQKLFDEPPSPTEKLIPVGVQSIEVRGDVQAGVWRDAIEWGVPERYRITVPENANYSGFPRYGLLVRGDSMNKVFPDGTVVIVINYSDLGRLPRTGEYAVALRRSSCGGEFEATIKAVQVKDNGDIVLWPKSTEPEFVPVILPYDHGADYASGMDGHSNGVPDIQILALVVGAYQTNLSATF